MKPAGLEGSLTCGAGTGNFGVFQLQFTCSCRIGRRQDYSRIFKMLRICTSLRPTPSFAHGQPLPSAATSAVAEVPSACSLQVQLDC